MLALATTFIVACQKDNEEMNLRSITASLNNSDTKTALGTDGKTPKWNVGDQVWISNGTASEIVTVTPIDDSKATFTTALAGKLYAVYPSSCAPSTPSVTPLKVTIPMEQAGTFASANICVAEEVAANSLAFSNAASVIPVANTNEDTGIDFAAAYNIAGTVSVTFGADNTINVATEELSCSGIKVAGLSGTDTRYIAVAPVTTGSIKVFRHKGGNTAVQSFAGRTFARNTICKEIPAVSTGYNSLDCGVIDGRAYITDKGVKWAMENLYKDAAGMAQVGETGHIKGSLYSYEEAKEYMKDSGWCLPRQEDYQPLDRDLSADDSKTGVTDGIVYFHTLGCIGEGKNQPEWGLFWCTDDGDIKGNWYGYSATKGSRAFGTGEVNNGTEKDYSLYLRLIHK